MDSKEFKGHRITEGDVLHDVADGPVMVIEVNANNFICRLMAHEQRRVSYAYTGIQARRPYRTLFWQYPILFEPLKDSSQWEAQRYLITEMAKVLGNYAGSPDTQTVLELVTD